MCLLCSPENSMHAQATLGLLKTPLMWEMQAFLLSSQASFLHVSSSLHIIYLCGFQNEGESHLRWRCHLQYNNSVPDDEKQTPPGSVLLNDTSFLTI